MTFARLLARSLPLCLLAAAATRCAAQQPSDPATPPPVRKPAPIVRPVPALTPSSPEDAPVTPPPAPPKHLTVARPVTKPPQTTNPDGTPAAASAPKPTAPKPVIPKPVVPKPTPPKPTTTAAPTAAPAPPTTAPISINRSIVVLDPAHGGGDTGSRITDSLTEKDVTLALAFRIRSLLSARGFTVVMTRETDNATTPDKPATSAGPAVPGTPLTLDDRAGLANHAHPVACLLLHATGSGSGVHLYSSELDAVPSEPTVVPWLKAQAAWVPQSQHLVSQLGTAFTRARIPLVQSAASIRPVDSLSCPALVVELAPDSAGNPSSISDGAYQQRVAEAIAGALVFWQGQVQPPVRILPPPPPTPVYTPAPASPTGAVQP